MKLTLTIPDPVTVPLQSHHGENLERFLLECLAAEGYRSGSLSRYQVQQLLGFDNRWETEEWLGERGICANYSLDDLESDRETTARWMAK